MSELKIRQDKDWGTDREVGGTGRYMKVKIRRDP